MVTAAPLVVGMSEEAGSVCGVDSVEACVVGAETGGLTVVPLVGAVSVALVVALVVGSVL